MSKTIKKSTLTGPIGITIAFICSFIACFTDERGPSAHAHVAVLAGGAVFMMAIAIWAWVLYFRGCADVSGKAAKARR